MAASGEIDLEVLLEDLAHTKQRLYKVEVQQECIINTLRAVLPKEEVELFEAYLHDALSDDPFEIPVEATSMMAMLQIIFKKIRENDDKRAVQNLFKAKPCKVDPLNAKRGFNKKSNSPQRSGG